MPAGPETAHAVEPPGVVVDAATATASTAAPAALARRQWGGLWSAAGAGDDLMAQVESGMSAPAQPSEETAAWAASLLASIPGPGTAPRVEQPIRTRSQAYARVATDTRRASATQQPARPASEGGEAPDPRLEKRPVHFVLRCSRCGTMWTRDLASAINIGHRPRHVDDQGRAAAGCTRRGPSTGRTLPHPEGAACLLLKCYWRVEGGERRQDQSAMA